MLQLAIKQPAVTSLGQIRHHPTVDTCSQGTSQSWNLLRLVASLTLVGVVSVSIVDSARKYISSCESLSNFCATCDAIQILIIVENNYLLPLILPPKWHILCRVGVKFYSLTHCFTCIVVFAKLFLRCVDICVFIHHMSERILVIYFGLFRIIQVYQ